MASFDHLRRIITNFNDSTHNWGILKELFPIGRASLATNFNYSTTFGTTFPTTPSDGDMHVYPCDAITSTPSGAGTSVSWLFYYVSADNDWRFIGGPPLSVADSDSRSTSSATYVAVPTDGMSITLPLAGTYDITVGASFDPVGGIVFCYYSFDVAGASPSGTMDDRAVAFLNMDPVLDTSKETRVTGIAATNVIAEKFKTSGGTFGVSRRRMFIRPVVYTP